MEASLLTVLPPPLTLVSSLLLLLLLSLALKISRGRRDALRLPPGSVGFPLVGETLRMISAYKTESPDSFIDDRVRKHRNRVFTSHVFGERTVFSADPDVNRLVLHSEGKLFESSYPSSITTLLGRHSLLLTRAAYHRRMHSLTLSSFSNPAVLRDLLLPDIHHVVRRNLRSWGAQDRVLSLLDHAKKITFELAVRQLMSCEAGEWTEGLRREYLLLIDGFFSVPLPFPFTTYGRALKARAKVAHQIRMVVRNRIAEHAGAESVPKTTARSNNNTINHKDVLDRLLAEGVREEEVVVDFLLALLVAGYETTPTAMTLAVKFLTETPAALAMLREEHDRVRERRPPRERGSGDGAEGEDDDAFDWADYKTAMPFTHSVINETLRIANIISGVFRRATTDVHIKGGYVIPKGCKVFASFRAVHMDQEHFEDARTFNPWRWHRREEVDQRQDEMENREDEAKRRGKSSATRATTAQPTFCVFGGGARLCPGYELARVELCVFLHHLVTAFSWDAADEDKLVFFPTTRTLKGYPIRVRRRPPTLPTET